ncbi:putative heme-binding domain-containing protein [Roseimicrobium gellanilyticum]|uniref:Putative heme-binding domain-containing protein n=1 Tax=Roseimicrobium gellanilyticum TaxID=748857 RepID=A0A366H8F7_9BACT|nr:c-type cytochrome [Roseimicrobium gellanilyticum]RBP37651.1 putative heme-binding domain-containing protein [Roseimicrobium gellanilyticum]
MTHMLSTVVPLLLVGILGGSLLAEQPSPKMVEQGGFRLPEDFECRLYADDDLAHDISCMTFDSQGRVVVSGPGYIKTLMTDPAAPADAPKAKQAVLFSEVPKSGAQGLCFVGNDLYASGDGAVWKFTDANGDGAADGPPVEFVSGLKTGGEHGVHNIIQGPDGWLYIIGGNDSGISETLNNIPTAPIRKVTGGAILRVSLDGKQREVIAHGFRNPYDLCFNSVGSLFTWDSDGERVQHLPFYTPCRVFDVGRGRHHGWVNAGWQSSWSRPQWWPDVVDRMIEVGRGSPTGMRCYRHRQFPERYRDGIFFACWTFGRIYFIKPERVARGGGGAHADKYEASYKATHEVFLESTGNAGFSPTALAIAPDGSLFVSTGGRKTKGGVYRISYGARAALMKPDDPKDALAQVLAADQPDAAWSRAKWVPQAKELGESAFERWLLAETLGNDQYKDIRAVEILTELFGGVAPKVGEEVSWRFRGDIIQRKDGSRTNRAREFPARMAWASERNTKLEERQANDWFQAFAVEAGSHGHRAAYEAIMMTKGFLGKSFKENGETEGMPNLALQDFKRASHFGDKNSGDMGGLRGAQLRVGDVYLDKKARWDDGYVSMKAETKRNAAETESMHDLWNNGTAEQDYEYARLVAMTGAEPRGFWETLPFKWTRESSVEDDLHYLFVATRRTKPHVDHALPTIACAWLDLSRKMQTRQQYPSRFWSEMVGAAFAEMLKKNPKLVEVMIAQKEFELAEHTLFINAMEGDVRQEAVFMLAQRVKTWSPELVKLAGEVIKERTPKLSEGSQLALQRATDPAVRKAILNSNVMSDPKGAALLELVIKQVADLSLRDAAILSLPEYATPYWSIAVRGMESFQASVVEKSLDMMVGTFMPCPNAGGEEQTMKNVQTWWAENCVIHLRAARRFQGQSSREKLLVRLKDAAAEHLKSTQRVNGRKLETFEEIEAAVREFFPEQAKALPPSSILNLAEEQARWAKLDVSKGDSTKGKVIFEQRQCARCHSGNARLGPDLKGVTTRWSVADLFLHTSDPSRQISPTWEGETFTLKDGRQFIGRAVYDSPSAVLVQTTPDETVRITGEELQSRRKAEVSLMPPGLLMGLTDAELADLHAYLRTLQ